MCLVTISLLSSFLPVSLRVVINCFDIYFPTLEPIKLLFSPEIFFNQYLHHNYLTVHFLLLLFHSSRHNRRLEDKLEDTKGRVYTDSLDNKESLLKSEISNDTENA